jgi:hypothetical protein
MKCFTVFNTHIFDSLYVTEGKICGDECLAKIDQANILPPPDMFLFLSGSDFKIPYTKEPDHYITNADVFEFNSNSNGIIRKDYPAIIAEQKRSEDALVAIIMGNLQTTKGLLDQGEKVKLYIDVGGKDHRQFLVKMGKDSAISLTTLTATITLTWDGVDLNLNKKTTRQ